jgi:hypothetical protein
MAVESLKSLTFSTKSDVWSYGITDINVYLTFFIKLIMSDNSQE